MGESTKALLGGWIFLATFGALTVWFAVGVPDLPIVWCLRVGLPLTVLFAAFLLIKNRLRKDLAPDFLRAVLGVPFERDGVCFSVLLSAKNGRCMVHVLFQNQYASACRFRVVVWPPAKSFLGDHKFAGLAMNIDCDGGAFGVASAPMGIPAIYQGRTTKFDVGAATKYPAGRGQLLRFRNGMRAGKASGSALGSTALTAGLLLVGHVHMSRPASIVLTPPTGVEEQPISGGAPSVQVLWKPGDDAEAVAENLKQCLAA